MNAGSLDSGPSLQLLVGSVQRNVKPPQTIGAAGNHEEQPQLRVREDREQAVQMRVRDLRPLRDWRREPWGDTWHR